MAEQVKRVDSGSLSQYKGQVVRCIGKAQLVNGESVVFESNGTMKLLIPGNISLNEHEYYEITGKIADDLSIRVLDSVSLGSEISEY